MIITCPSCSARYKLDPTQFGPEGRRVRCTKCAHVWTQMPADDLPRAILPEPEPSSEPGPDPQAASAGETADDRAPRLASAAGDAADGRVPSAAARAARAAAARRSQDGASPSRKGRAGWLVLALVVISVGAALALAREAVVRAWPPAERLYAVLGIDGPRLGSGLAIKVTEHRQDLDGKTVILIVKGEVTNTSKAVQDVPKLKATLRTGAGQVIADWTFATAQARLLPGETAPFVTRLDNPARDGTVLNIDFTADGR